MSEVKIIEGSAKFLCAAVELAMGRIDLCKCSECGGPRDNGWACGECGEGYCDPTTEDCHVEAAVHAINNHDTLTQQVAELRAALLSIKNRQQVLSPSGFEFSSVWQVANKALEEKQ